MGLLVAKKYPTKLFLKAADHTYVECGNGGKAWSCWGGKTGGTAFNSGSGSTKQADCIAHPDERAGITCYLINGVCHQAANRILFPAKILVSAARGYALSSAIFGTYGKDSIWPFCHSTFDLCAQVSGDLPECMTAGPATVQPQGAAPSMPMKPGEDRHIDSIRQSYSQFDFRGASPVDKMQFHVNQFMAEAEFRLGTGFESLAQGLQKAKESVEKQHMELSEAFGGEEISPAEFIKAFNNMTYKFQDDLASALSAGQFRTLLDTDRDERVVLADPDIVKSIYGEQVVKEVYGELPGE